MSTSDSTVGVSVLYLDGVDPFVTGRDAAFLLAIGHQLDLDRAAEAARFDRAYSKLWAAVTKLESGR